MPSLGEMAARSGHPSLDLDKRCERAKEGVRGWQARIAPRVATGNGRMTSRLACAKEIPKTPKLRSRELKVFGAIEVAYYQFLSGEKQTLRLSIYSNATRSSSTSSG
jgi:hypothetical protein